MPGRPLSDLVCYLRKLASSQQTQELTDRDLVQRFVTRKDQDAFEAILMRHGPMVWKVCRALLADGHAAEDAFQATWLVFVRKAASIFQLERLGNWLYGVAHKIAAKARAEARRQQTLEKQGGDMAAYNSADELTNVEESRVLHEELNRLPARYRTPIVLCYLEGRTLQETADVLGWSHGAVRGRLERGRQRLRNRLERRGLGLVGIVLGTYFCASARAEVLPRPLVSSTVIAVFQFLARDRLVMPAATASAVALAEGVCRMMAITKIKATVFILLAVSLSGGSTGFLLSGRPTAVQAGDVRQEPKEAAVPVAKEVEDEDKDLTTPAERIKALLDNNYGDALLPKALLKNRYEAAFKEFDGRWKEFKAGRGTLDHLLEVSRRLRDSESELCQKKADVLAALEKHVERAKRIAELNGRRFDQGRIDIMDHAQSQYFYFDAQIQLERTKNSTGPWAAK